MRWDFGGHLDQLYHFKDKEILNLEALSPLSKVMHKLVAEHKWEFNLNDSRIYVSFYFFFALYIVWILN